MNDIETARTFLERDDEEETMREIAAMDHDEAAAVLHRLNRPNRVMNALRARIAETTR